MTQFDSVQKVLDFAIENEEAAYHFYIDLASRTERPAMREVFEGFAQEERGHKARLLSMKQGKTPVIASHRLTDLHLSDSMTDAEITPNLSYEEALVVAMKKEKAAFRLYMDLAEAATDPAVRSVFRGLAQEEAKHKLRFEIEYDEYVLAEN